MSQDQSQQKDAQPNPSDGRDGSSATGRMRAPILVAIVGVALTTGLWLWLGLKDDQLRAARFENDAEQIVLTFEREFATRVEIVRALSAFYVGSMSVEPDEFRDFSRPLIEAQRGGLLAALWLPRVDGADRAKFVQDARSDRFDPLPQYRLTDLNDRGELIDAAERDDYYPIRYVEPRDPNERLLGFDYASTPARRAAMTASSTEGSPVSLVDNAIMALHRPEERGVAVVVFMPGYRRVRADEAAAAGSRELLGYVAGVFRVSDVMKHTLRYVDQTDIAMTFYEGESPEGKPLFEYGGQTTPTGEASPARQGDIAPLTHLSRITVGGRTWSVMCRATNHYAARSQSHALRHLAGLTGLLFTLVLTVYASTLATRHWRVRRLVEQQTANFRQANAELQNEVAQRREAQEQLRLTTEALRRSNQELQQFAYVASHDLQEPLRMVASYLQLIERRYGGKLDDDAKQFIAFAVDGARRMHVLIHDLLEYSRVGTQSAPFQAIDLNDTLQDVKRNLQVAMEEQRATVTSDPLPRVRGDRTQLMQLLQNLIGNALKFRGQDPPRIHVSAEQRDGEWTIHVSDNGIGIDPKYADRVFVIFQRLHTREQYAGTGIGLAICKRIAERHGGRIWFEPRPGGGTIFHFTLSGAGDEA